MIRIKGYRLLDAFKNKWILFFGEYRLKKKEEKKYLERYRRFLRTKKPIYLFFVRYSKYVLDLKEIEIKTIKQEKNFKEALFFLKKLNYFQIKKMINLIFK